LGRGWRHNYSSSLLISTYAVTLYKGDGSGISFSRTATDGIFNPFPSYGDHSTITQNLDGTYMHTEKNGTQNNYDQNGRLTSAVDRNGNTLALSYTGPDLTAITDSVGRTTTLTYDFNDRISRITGPDPSKIVTFTYTSAGYLNSVSDTLGDSWRYTYNSAGRMLTKTDPSNFTTTYAYDYSGRISSSIDPEGKTKTIAYNPSSHTATVTEKDRGIWVHTYDAILLVPVRDVDPLGSVTTYTYDSNRNRTSQTDPSGNTTTYTYDAAGNMTSVTDALNNTTTYTYNSFGEITSMTDPLSNVTNYAYDANGNLLTITDPSGDVTRYTYDAIGNVWTMTNAAGQTTTYLYDQYNNLLSVTDPSGKTTTFSYDFSGNMTGQTDAAGKTTSYTYNVLDQLTSVTDPLGDVTDYTYDPKGNRATLTDPNGNVTSYRYNYNNQQTMVTDALGNVTSYAYGTAACSSCNGGADKLTSVTDAREQRIQYEYDLLGRLTKMTDQLGKSETYTYYPNGNLHTMTDRKGQTTTYSYDGANRMTRADYADSSYTIYDYDEIGKIRAITDSITGTISYTYTTAESGMPVGLVLAETTSQGSITYAYDSVGRRTSMTVTGEPSVNYQYDAGGRLTGISTQNQQLTTLNFSIGYDTVGRRASVTYPNGVTTNFTYDDASRMTSLQHLNPLNAVLESLGYTYDANGNRIGMDRQNVGFPQRAATTGIIYNTANQMLAFNTQNMTYDANGNMTSLTNACGTTNYTWDARNRLVGIQGYKPDCAPLTAFFEYDALGRRIEKTINGRSIQYLYDGLDIVQQIENGLPSVNYIRTLNIDEPLARIDAAGVTRYYHADALGSIIGLSDESGQEVTKYSYDAFGNVTVSGEVSDNPFQYTGRENDGTGLYYYRARYYNPALQRFISEDPIGLWGGINKYAYALNNPVNLVDRFGLAVGPPIFPPGLPGEPGHAPEPPGSSCEVEYEDCCDEYDQCNHCLHHSHSLPVLVCPGGRKYYNWGKCPPILHQGPAPK